MQENPLWLRAKLEEVTSQRDGFHRELQQTLRREKALETKLAVATASLQEAASMMQEAAQAEVENDTSGLKAEVPIDPDSGRERPQPAHPYSRFPVCLRSHR